MTELTKNFEYLLVKNGPPNNAIFMDADFFEIYNERLPKALIDFLQQYGLGEWFGGLLRFVDPREFYSTLALWFGADKDFNHQNAHVIAINAFGDLYIWHEKFLRIKIQSTYSIISGSYLFKSEQTPNPEIVVSSTFMTLNPTDDFDEFDEEDKPLFKRCATRLGLLDKDEIYGFKLPISLGGQRRIENLGKVKMKEHLMILAQTEPLKLMDYSTFPPRFVREIG
jgi:hypothetical protein